MRLPLPALWLALVAAACTPSTLPESPSRSASPWELSSDGGRVECAPDGGVCVPVSPAITQGDSCPDRRWVAVLTSPDGACPSVDGAVGGEWVARRLFQESTASLALPPGLRPFCSYDWVPSSTAPGAPDVARLQARLLTAVQGESAPASQLDRDCHVVAPLGTSAGVEAGWQTLHARFQQQVERLSSLPVDSTHWPEAVRVAVVDSTPHGYVDGKAGAGQLSHGHVVGRVIRELGCPDGLSSAEGSGAPCVAQVSNHLALPQVTPTTRDLAHGGYFGLQSQLALAVHQAVTDWRLHALTPEAPERRLVLNLSLGWEGLYGGASVHPLGEDLPAPARAVHAALVHAVCRGALPLAAAGNEPGGPEPVQGPMYPAGWETKAAPTQEACGALEGSGYPGQAELPLFAPGVDHPLVYAVGGVRGDDTPLSSSRPGGRPRLAAPGAHAVAVAGYVGGTPRPSDVLTGTSMSTAVVSAIAATVWGYRPSLAGPQVMQALRRGAVDLGQPADFCLGGAPCPWPTTDARRAVRRVSLCRAVLEACDPARGGGGEHCPAATALPVCPARPAYDGSLRPTLSSTQLGAMDAALGTVVGGSAAMDFELGPLPVCRHASLFSSVGSYASTVCPLRQYYGVPLRPWTHPQPGANPCPLCVVEAEASTSSASTSSTPAATARVWLSIDSDYTGLVLTDATLVLNGAHEVLLPGLPALTAGSEVRVDDVPLPSGAWPLHRAVLTLRGQDSATGAVFSTHSELLVQ